MRVESMAAQQAVLAASTRQASRGPRAARADSTTPANLPNRGQLPTAVADRLADFFAADPGFAEAVSAQLPAARQTTARDFAAYGRSDAAPRSARLIDITG